MALERGTTHEKVSLHIGARALPKVGALRFVVIVITSLFSSS